MTSRAWNAVMKVLDARVDAIMLAEVAHVATAKALFVKESGREATSKEELHDWAEHTHRHNLASILRQAPPHITEMFPGRNEP